MPAGASATPLRSHPSVAVVHRAHPPQQARPHRPRPAAPIPRFDYAADARTTATPDWACIRQWESGDNYRDPSGAYGVLETTAYAYGLPWPVSDASVPAQNHVALELFAANGHHFIGTWNGSPQQCGLT